MSHEISAVTAAKLFKNHMGNRTEMPVMTLVRRNNNKLQQMNATSVKTFIKLFLTSYIYLDVYDFLEH